MNVVVLKHAPFERLGQIEVWLQAKSASVETVVLYEPNVRYPDLASTDLVIALGGPMSVNDEVNYPWLVAEKQYIRDVIEADIPLLGICLGGQLIATALGAKVTDNPEVEIGWHTVSNVSDDATVFRFPDELEIFNWHGETFALPEGAKRLIESKVCPNQGFQLGERIIGLQCHPEVTPRIIQEWVDEIGEQMTKGDYVQQPSVMLAEPEVKMLTVRPVLFDLLDYLVRDA
ncbi:MAG: type 1 glutamine amidotransferase [Hydrogenovibrio sp.]